MGAEESKQHGNYGLMGAGAVVANMNRQAQYARPWALLHQCSLDQWKAGHGEAAGFSENALTCTGIKFKDCSPTFCTSRQGIININKSSSMFSFRRRSKFTKMAEHFEYNHIPAQLSSIQNFHVKSVLCYHGNVVILHLIRNLMSQFGIIHVGTANKFVGFFGKQSVEFVNEALRGEVTPDGKKCLILLPCLVPSFRPYVFQLYNLETKELVSQVSLPFNHSLFAFDPRFNSVKLAVTSFINGEDNSLSLVRTDSWEVLETNSRVCDTSTSLHPNLKDVLYSRDGTLIFTQMVTSGCHCVRYKSRRSNVPVDVSIYIFNSDSTQTLHCVQYTRYVCGEHSCPINFKPIFSRCSSRVAMVLNDTESPIDHIQIYKLPTDGSLQNRCRIRILQHFPHDIVPTLPLPSRLIEYLSFKPEFE